MDKPTVKIKFDDQSVFQRIMENKAHPILTDLIYWCFAAGIFKEITNTSNYRAGDKGVHGTIPYRGFDVRSFDMENPQLAVDQINAHWEYDSVRPDMKCAMLHNVGRGMHIHLQVHPNTVMIKGGW